MISFIIPAYNAEKTIEKCIDSILHIQNYEIEVIIINDGSTDDTLNECLKIDDERVLIITQKNKGVSAARNRGILEARGDYVVFVDSDDEIDASEMEKALLKTDEKEEIILYNFIRKKDGAEAKDAPILEPGKYNKDTIEHLIRRMLDAPTYKYKKSTVIQGSAARYIISKRFLIDNRILFVENLSYAEDLCFSVALLKKANRIYITCCYPYTINILTGSNSRKYINDYWLKLKTVHGIISGLTNKNEEELYYSYGCSALNHYILYLSAKDAEEKCRDIIYDEKMKQSIKSINFRNKTKIEACTDKLLMNNQVRKLVLLKKTYFNMLRVGSYIKRKIWRNTK